MLVKASSIILVLTVALSFTPALAAPHVLDVPGPSLVVLETNADAELGLEDGTLSSVVLESSPSHLVLAAAEPGVLVVNGAEDAEVAATVTRVRVVEHDVFLDGVHAVARSLYAIALDTKEEDHDIDPDPKRAGERPLVTLLDLDDAVVLEEEDHSRPLGGSEGGPHRDPDPKRGSTWTGDWALTSAAVAELGPGWYFVVRGGEVSCEVVVQGR